LAGELAVWGRDTGQRKTERKITSRPPRYINRMRCPEISAYCVRSMQQSWAFRRCGRAAPRWSGAAFARQAWTWGRAGDWLAWLERAWLGARARSGRCWKAGSLGAAMLARLSWAAALMRAAGVVASGGRVDADRCRVALSGPPRRRVEAAALGGLAGHFRRTCWSVASGGGEVHAQGRGR
jgi:hypothetical protein